MCEINNILSSKEVQDLSLVNCPDCQKLYDELDEYIASVKDNTGVSSMYFTRRRKSSVIYLKNCSNTYPKNWIFR
jgi:hypothetical protein